MTTDPTLGAVSPLSPAVVALLGTLSERLAMTALERYAFDLGQRFARRCQHARNTHQGPLTRDEARVLVWIAARRTRCVWSPRKRAVLRTLAERRLVSLDDYTDVSVAFLTCGGADLAHCYGGR